MLVETITLSRPYVEIRQARSPRSDWTDSAAHFLPNVPTLIGVETRRSDQWLDRHRDPQEYAGGCTLDAWSGESCDKSATETPCLTEQSLIDMCAEPIINAPDDSAVEWEQKGRSGPSVIRKPECKVH